jgi:hypothetical protein
MTAWNAPPLGILGKQSDERLRITTVQRFSGNPQPVNHAAQYAWPQAPPFARQNIAVECRVEH